jgi:hypothetical protein
MPDRVASRGAGTSRSSFPASVKSLSSGLQPRAPGRRAPSTAIPPRRRR